MISLKMARKIILDFNPDVVVGVGGYASGPVLRSAARKGIPTLIQEQNSYAGLTNRLLGKRAGKICVAYEGMEKYFPTGKIILSGNPVREVIVKLESAGSQAVAKREFGLKEDAKVILVLGGSLGARTINRAVIAGLQQIAGSGVKMIWQCGRFYTEEARASLEGMPAGSVILKEFIERMDLAYRAADLIVARAGAITISELCHVGKPAILIPSPNVAEDHQTRNANSLVDQGAAICLPDHEAVSGMMAAAIELLGNDTKQAALSKNIKALAFPDSGGRIAEEIISLMNDES